MRRGSDRNLEPHLKGGPKIAGVSNAPEGDYRFTSWKKTPDNVLKGYTRNGTRSTFAMPMDEPQAKQ